MELIVPGRTRGMQQRWFDDLAEAQACLESIPLAERGEWTTTEPLKNGPYHDCWRVDRCMRDAPLEYFA